MTCLCHIDDLPDNQARGFQVELDGESRPVLLVRRGMTVYGYINVCPHRGTSLDWLPDRFMDAEGRHLQCATHGARFEVETGHCISGPCSGLGLTPVVVAVHEGHIHVTY
ncbi:MAG TPA: Rieske 2Fe-2S domain-containing protein [Gammaproteobacteria bacterium]|nr:Rieske 2Fe-2S domain-containing protein [Gammaproteobacteria bacterium]